MQQLAQDLCAEARALGWDDVGIARAEIPQSDLKALKSWLQKGYHGALSYMENEARFTPEALLPGAKTAVICVSYYKQPNIPLTPGLGLVASYARGRDYHHVHRRRLKHLISWLEKKTEQQGIARGFSDAAPVLEKALAVQAGLGWFGKNTLLIHRRFGTYLLLAGILTTLELPCHAPVAAMPRCGTCSRCIDACPTGALVAPYSLDATKCLSYHLIESKTEIPSEIKRLNPGYVFGCDICQQVCPHNALKPVSLCKDFSPEIGVGPYLSWEVLHRLEACPSDLFGTPLQRRKVEGLRYNLECLRDSG